MVYGVATSRSRNCTELCNRNRSIHCSGRPTIAHDLEDYWEDASVSLKPCHSSWEDNARVKMYPPGALSHTASHGDSTVSVKRLRRFPPPLASCTTFSIKGGGRFVLKEIVGAHRSQGFFRVERETGRLRLHLVLPDDEVASATTAHDDDEDVDDHDLDCCILHNDGGEGDTENVSIGLEACNGCGLDNQEGIVGDHGTCRRPVCVRDDGESVDGEDLSTCSSANVDTRQECATWDKSPGDHGCGNVGLEASRSREPYEIYRDGGSVDEEASTSCGGIFKLEPAILMSTEGSTSSSTELDYALGQQHQEKFWNASTKGASLSMWPPSQLLVRQPLVRIRPALGLAMS